MRIRPVNMEFRYGTTFLSESPEAYERLILDALRGDATLFTRDDEVEASWDVCDPILEAWSASDGPLPSYPAGGGGPEEADALLGSSQLASALTVMAMTAASGASATSSRWRSRRRCGAC